MARPSQRLTKTITTTYTITLADCGYKIICNSASPFAITLPSATGLYNFDVLIQNIGAGAVTCDSKTINQNCSMLLSNNSATTWVSTVIDSYGNLISKGNIEAGSTKISISGTPTNSVFGGGISIDVPDASTTQKGAMQVGDGLNSTSGLVKANTDRVTTKTSSSTLTADEEGIIVCNHSATPIVITLPSYSTRTGLWYKIVNIGVAGTIANGVSLYTGDSTMFFSDGSQWINYGLIKNRTLYTQTGTETITNTITETSLINGGKGSLTVPPNATQIGDSIRIKIYGYISTNNPAPTARLRVYYGSTAILDSTETLPAGLTNQYFEVEIIGTARTIGATGTIFVQGRVIVHNGSGVTTVGMRQLLSTSAVTVDTTTSQTISVTYTWYSANTNNSIVSTNATIELLRP